MEVDNGGHLVCILGDGTGYNVANSIATISSGAYHHLACSWNGTTIIPYIDGVASGSGNQTLTSSTNPDPLLIGAFSISPSTVDPAQRLHRRRENLQ